MRTRLRRCIGPLAAAALGAAFFVWIAGLRVITPTDTAWAMQGDWRVHFLGWQFFRFDAWHWPPGRIDNYFMPLATSVGLTDAIPLVAFIVKPFSAWLPGAVQYLGPWMCACFALQGFFAALLVRIWTTSVVVQLLGASCFVMIPTLLMRTIHPALCAHWLLLWAMWLYLRTDASPRQVAVSALTISLIAGMVHPYLAVMTLLLVTALAVRLLAGSRVAGAITMLLAVVGTVAGWWLSGIFVVSGADNLVGGGLEQFSMNLLAPITPTGWSSLLPEWPLGAEAQAWEGFQYLGLGILLLLLAAAVTTVVTPRRRAVVWWPLVLVAGTLAIYSLSPRVTLGSAVVLHLDSSLIEPFAAFRATGRFFWPAAYLLVTWAVSVIVSSLTPRRTAVVLCVVLIVQVIDLQAMYRTRRQAFRDPVLHSWDMRLPSPAWPRILQHYARITVYPPSYCDPSGLGVEQVAYLAGLNHVSINDGLVARFDNERRVEACRQLTDRLLRGEVEDATLYLARADQAGRLRTLATQPVVCGVIDAIGVCATTRSYAPWQGLAHLE